MERLTTRIEDKVYYSKGEYSPTTLIAEMKRNEIRECINRLAEYEDMGTIDEIKESFKKQKAKNRHELVYKKDGKYAIYGRVPYPITDWKGIVFFIETLFIDLEEHKKIVENIADMLESDSYDHGSEWRLDKEKLIYDNERLEKYITLIDFRVKDSY